MKLLVEKDELLEEKQKEFETMKDKLLRGYAEMENVMSRTKREAENSKKFAIQVLSLSLSRISASLFMFLKKFWKTTFRQHELSMNPSIIFKMGVNLCPPH
jgi:molecular chaperone GrpE (heat shock protein)